VHVFDPLRFPYAQDAWYIPSPAETGTPALLDQVLTTHGVRHALIVGPNSGYGLDNRCLLDTLAQGHGRYKGIAVVKNDASLSELQDLKAAGVVGVAFNPALLGTAFYADTGPLLKRLRDLDMWVQVQVEGDQLLDLNALLKDSGVKVLFDHFGHPNSPQRLRAASGFGQRLVARSGRSTSPVVGNTPTFFGFDRSINACPPIGTQPSPRPTQTPPRH
jgi:predicted TIM-barrel fold metal-dependent hydrolase